MPHKRRRSSWGRTTPAPLPGPRTPSTMSHGGTYKAFLTDTGTGTLKTPDSEGFARDGYTGAGKPKNPPMSPFRRITGGGV